MMETIRRLKEGKTYVKPITYTCGLACIVSGIFYGVIILLSASVPTLYSYCAPIYFVAFGIIMLSADLGLKAVVENCSFLDLYVGRGLFNVFVGAQISNQAATAKGEGIESFFYIFGTIVGQALIALGLYLIILHALEKKNKMTGLLDGELKTKVAKAVFINQFSI